MESYQRWAIGLGAGIFAGMAVLGVHHVTTSDAQNEMAGHAINQLVPDYSELDVVMEFDTYDVDEFVTMATMLQDADVKREIGCGGYPNPAHVCSADATFTAGLELKGAKTDVVRDSYALTIGEYRSEYTDILERASSVLVDTGTGLRPVTYEGNGTFTLGYLAKSVLSSKSEPWQFAIASVGYTPVWLSAAALAAVIAVLVTASIRPTRTPEVEEVGVEFFDVLTEEPARE